MDQRVVVGVGNIYAAEALFAAGVSPLRAAAKVSRERYRLLADAVRRILENPITPGRTTLRDFLAPAGAPGYFVQALTASGPGGRSRPTSRRPLHHAHLRHRHSFLSRRSPPFPLLPNPTP